MMVLVHPVLVERQEVGECRLGQELQLHNDHTEAAGSSLTASIL